MNTNIEPRVTKLELYTKKLSESSLLANEVLTELVSDLPNAIREQIKEEMVFKGREIQSNVMTSVNKTVDKKIDDKFVEKFDERGLSKYDADRLTKARYKRMRELLGNSKSDEYKLFIPFYQGCLRNGYYKKFNVNRYADIKPSQFNEALIYIQNFDITDRSWCVQALHDTYRNNEFANNKLVHAYERYFCIVQS